MSETSRSLLAHTPVELKQAFIELGAKPFHAKIAREALLQGGAMDYASMTALPAGLRERLPAAIPLLTSTVVDSVKAKDGTIKLLLRFPRVEGKDALVETVHIPPLRSHDAEGQPKGATLCVSTQVGCPVACPFCASGLDGLTRNLEAHEIVEQYVHGRQVGPLSRSVVMGIGEPLLNVANLQSAMQVVHEEIGLGARKITVSSVGFPDRLRRLADDKPPFQLAISLHTPFDEQRAELVPAMSAVPIDDILAAGDYWFQVTGREVTYEIVLLGGTTDTYEHADYLATRLHGRRCSVNLIPYNPTAGLGYERPHQADVDGFRDHLIDAGLIATVRWSRGLEGSAACGQLRAQTLA
ncbi:MAG: 23S rRNA (adenine2503-C2)-methyltransferase [Planctomycetota bacterium]